MRAQSPIRTLEIEDGDGKVAVYRFGLTWAAYGRLQDTWGVDLAEVEKKLQTPDFKTINDVLKCSAVPTDGQTFGDDDLSKLSEMLSPVVMGAFITELLEASQPPPKSQQRPTPAAPTTQKTDRR